MNKLFIITALAVSTLSGQAIAIDSFSIEVQSMQSTNGSADMKNFNMTVRRDINSFVTGYVQDSGTQIDGTNAVSNRLEAGATTIKLIGSFSGYATLGVGKLFRAAGNYSYYQAEPGVRIAIGSGLTAHVGYRYRAAFNSAITDTTHTARVGLSYAITKQDLIGVRYDRVMHDTEQNVFALNYTHSF